MPYLNSKIKEHNEGCKNPNVKRLYIRDYDSTGIQHYVPYGITCLNCHALVVETLKLNPTKTKLSKYGYKTAEEYHKKREAFNQIMKQVGL
jgi:hypothetical protein